ncbi:MAG: hypothetical protein KKA16_14740 [Alphaproteobacteria bacterium]|uniref:Uncharacterized protein n=1 Tax=viral metagenome TaxID=1070528 RepID=A0A6H1ZI76_9ZZZZ|nr:hypothetical protein [Alphaproteobacteria bacterium]MBU2379186.1 hypothetical protein [Alphaproteobacteria bacterium]
MVRKGKPRSEIGAGSDDAVWVRLAPTIRWKLRTPDRRAVAALAVKTAEVMGSVYSDASVLAAVAGSSVGQASSRIKGEAAVIAACLWARWALADWSGVQDLATGKPADWRKPEAVKAALLAAGSRTEFGLLVPFLAWMESIEGAGALDAARLELRAYSKWGDGAPPGSWAEPNTQAGVASWEVGTDEQFWRIAGGSIEGLDYHAALLRCEELAGGTRGYNHGAAFNALQAIERGRMAVANG